MIRSLTSGVWQAPAGMSLAGAGALWLVDRMWPMAALEASQICGHAPAAPHCTACYVAGAAILAGLAMMARAALVPALARTR